MSREKKGIPLRIKTETKKRKPKPNQLGKTSTKYYAVDNFMRLDGKLMEVSFPSVVAPVSLIPKEVLNR
jgi:hypothetical protein